MEYELLAPIDFSSRDQASDAQATDIRRLKNAAYEDSPRGTMSFFAFYRPIIEQYVSEFARLNPFFPSQKKADLFWLTMRHAFAILRSYEHKGYGSFRNLLRQLVNYNALQSADKMAYMEEMSVFERENLQLEFENMASLCLVLQQHPDQFANSKFIRNFLFYPERLGNIFDDPDENELLDDFGREVEAVLTQFANNRMRYGDIESLAPIIGIKKLAELVRKGGKTDLVESFFGRLREEPEWFGLPAKMFEDNGASVTGLADAAQP